jgi:Uma2 family endonuclease
MTAPTARPMTAEDLLTYHAPDKRTELVRGRLVVREPAGYEHGRVAGRVFGLLAAIVLPTRAGELLAAETGFTLQRQPDTVRAPDVAFIRADRVPPPGTRGFPELAPDLAVEVRSPGDTRAEVAEKVADWLAAGSALVWVVDPIARTVVVHAAGAAARTLGAEETLDGGDVLPAFCARVDDLFA